MREDGAPLGPFTESSPKHERFIDDLFQAQEAYFQYRADFWLILLELLKIDLDADHAMHSLAKSLLDKIIAEKYVIFMHILQRCDCILTDLYV